MPPSQDGPPPTHTYPDATVGSADSPVRSIAKNRSGTEVAGGRIRRRRALLIGIAEYQFPEVFRTLKYPINDVRDLDETLRGYGYSPVECMDDHVADPRMQPTRENILRALQRVCSEAEPDDLIWIHFSCHGMRWSDESGHTVRLLVTKDTHPPEPVQSALDLDVDVIQLLNSCKARQKVLTLDACQLGYGRSLDAKSDEQSLMVFELAEGLAILAASTSQQFAQENKDARRGVFTDSLIKVLRIQVERDRLAEFGKVARAVLAEVVNWYRSKDRLPQQPTHSFAGMGELLLVDRTPSEPGTKRVEPAGTEAPAIQLNDYTGLVEISRNSLGVRYQARTSKALDERESDVIVMVLNKEIHAQRADHLAYLDRLATLSGLTNLPPGKEPILGIPKILHKGETSTGLPYFTTEFVGGRKLSKVMDGGFTPIEVIEFGFQIASALFAAHGAGVVHGDLTPDKIMSSRERPCILEFVTAALDVKLRLTRNPNAPRSPYWPPELGPGAEQPAEPADVFALGKILQQMLGAPGTASALHDIPKELSYLLDDMQVPLTGGAKKPVRSRPNMQRVVRKLAELAGRPPPIPKPDPFGQRRRWLGPLAVAGAAALLVGGGLAGRRAPQSSSGFSCAGNLPHRADRSTGPMNSGPHPLTPEDLTLQRAYDVVSATLGAYPRTAAGDAPLGAVQRTAAERNQLRTVSVIREVGWLRELYFGKVLAQSLMDAGAPLDVRQQSAQALGRLNYQDAVPELEKLLRDSALPPGLWRDCLNALGLLSQERLQVVAKSYLTATDPRRRQVATVLLAPFSQEARDLLNKQRAQFAAARGSAAGPSEELEVLLGLAWALDDQARGELATRLSVLAPLTEQRAQQARQLVERGDRTGVVLLRQFVRSGPSAETSGEVVRTQKLLSHVDPSAEDCRRFTQLLSAPPPSERGSYYVALVGVASCPQPKQQLKRLAELLPDRQTVEADELDLRAYTALAIIRISSDLANAERLRAKIANGGDTDSGSEDATASQREAAERKRGLLAQLEADLKLALDKHAPAASRHRAARHVSVLEQASGVVKSGRGVARPAAPDLAELDRRIRQLAQRVQEQCASADSTDRIVCALASNDDKVVQEAMLREDKPDVQLWFADRVHSEEANRILRAAAAGMGSAAIRAYGELRKRQIKDIQPPANVNLLALYQAAEPDDRAELIDALSGWPFDLARPVLVPATHDGVVDVRRSAVSVIGEGVGAAESQLDALGVLRLMFQDNDEIVHQRILDILDSLNTPLSPSELPPAAEWPPKPSALVLPVPPPPPHPTHLRHCPVQLRGDDDGATIAISNKTLTLPVAHPFAPGTHHVNFIDDQGAARQITVQCLDGEAYKRDIPVSRIGQLLTQAIQDWEGKNLQGASQKLTALQSPSAAKGARSDGGAPTRRQDVLGRSYYYLGSVRYTQNNRPAAHEQLVKFLRHPVAQTQAALKKDAEDKRKQIEARLGRFVVKLRATDGSCQPYEVWVEPAEKTRITVDASHEFLEATHAGQTTKGPDECQ